VRFNVSVLLHLETASETFSSHQRGHLRGNTRIPYRRGAAAWPFLPVVLVLGLLILALALSRRAIRIRQLDPVPLRLLARLTTSSHAKMFTTKAAFMAL
jgi:hypothetical protein